MAAGVEGRCGHTRLRGFGDTRASIIAAAALLRRARAGAPAGRRDGHAAGLAARGARAAVHSCASSGGPTSGSNGRYREPKTVRELAAQVNQTATRVLNGEIDLETARVYSAMTRNVAQLVTAEVQKARFLRKEPDLTL